MVEVVEVVELEAIVEVEVVEVEKVTTKLVVDVVPVLVCDWEKVKEPGSSTRDADPR